jgi:hypothetical protein
MTALKEWSETTSSKTSSATLIIEPQNSRAAQRAETFAFEVADFLRRRGQSVVWAFMPEYDEPLTAGEVVHCLAQQLAQRTLPGNPMVIQDNRSPSDTLVRVFDELGDSFLVVQVKDLALAHAVLQAVRLSFKDKPTRVLKLLLISYSGEITSLALAFPQATVQVIGPPLPKEHLDDTSGTLPNATPPPSAQERSTGRPQADSE